MLLASKRPITLNIKERMHFTIKNVVERDKIVFNSMLLTKICLVKAPRILSKPHPLIKQLIQQQVSNLSKYFESQNWHSTLFLKQSKRNKNKKSYLVPYALALKIFNSCVIRVHYNHIMRTQLFDSRLLDSQFPNSFQLSF